MIHPDKEPTLTRAEADMMGLRYLRDEGPHTMGPIEDEAAMAAALVFLGLKQRGLATSTMLTRGYVQWAITPAGLALTGAAA